MEGQDPKLLELSENLKSAGYKVDYTYTTGIPAILYDNPGLPNCMHKEKGIDAINN
ncbi:hypothetical protein J4418_03150 [Candidatus Woesearchaeota archaeon]|nr:hypothetical protein [Candidatus Woesearchaeota archaeon]